MSHSSPIWPTLLSALALVTAGCASTGASEPTVPFSRSVIEPADVSAAIIVEASVDERSKVLPVPGETWFEVLHGTRGAIISAPHATRPMRQGQYRFSDGSGTAALASALHAICGVTAIYTIRDSPSDPNFYDDNDYKRALALLVAEKRPPFVLDLHGSHPSRPYDVDLGTMHGASLLGQANLPTDLVRFLRAEGLNNLSDNRFAASRQETVTKFASRLGIPAMQLEISTTRLQPGTGCDAADRAQSRCGGMESHRFAELLQALVRFLGSRGQCSRLDPGESSDG